jgi:RHS repeat-associated protein
MGAVVAEESRERSAYAAPSLSLPKGGGAIRGIGEKFTANPVTGTGALRIPIATSPGRAGFGPQLSLDYDSGSGNGPFGFGWGLSLPAITRKTDKGLPVYRDDEDVFILSGAEDLVPVPTPAGFPSPPGFTVQRYRPRIEGLFARVERWTDLSGVVHWRSVSRDNVTTVYGETENSRIFHPDDRGSGRPPRIFSWLICRSYDDKGNAIAYEYVSEDSRKVDTAQAHERNRTDRTREANRYLKRVKYGNTISRLQPKFADTEWLFEVVFDYGEGHLTAGGADRVHAGVDGTEAWPVRADPFSTYRAGFEVRTYRLCRRVLMFHHMPDELGIDDYLVRATRFDYDQSPIGSFLTSVTQSGYVARPAGLFLQRSLPAVELEYSKAVLSQDVHDLDDLPPDGYRWADLDGEGAAGRIAEQTGGWLYQRNLGSGSFAPPEPVAQLPSLGVTAVATQQLLDLSADGQLDLADFAGDDPGFYERTDHQGWAGFSPFRSLPRIDWNSPVVRYADLTGDGLADVVVTDEGSLVWHRSLGEDGFAPGERCHLDRDLALAEGDQSVYLSDLSGDGMPDLVRIRNGEVSYWPNLGYGRFGARLTMDDSPVFDRPEQFDQRNIRLADIDGSGTTDIIYLRRGEATIYRNLSGNGWGPPETLAGFPPVDDLSTVLATDLLGSGTACLVWCSPLPGDARRPMRYIDFMAEGKPHLLTGVRNNLGAEIRARYAPSTKFSLADRAAGTPWVTRLPMPVHVVEQVETWDWISRNRFVTTYAYHHGYFDGVEREFRGFGLVEQRDTEELNALVGLETLAENEDPASHIPPVLTRTWYHTGAYLDDAVLPPGLTADEEREASRALKGATLRTEIWALDDYPGWQPYAVTEQSYTIRVLQRRGAQRHAVFLTHPAEVVESHYERRAADPRVTQELTLEIDGWGNVLKSASIAYGRQTADPDLDLDEQKIQGRTLVTYTENLFTNDLDTPAAFRAPAAAETCTYELTGYSPAGRFRPSDLVRPGASGLVHVYDTEFGYHQTPTGGRQRRPIEKARTYYRPDDLGVSLGDPLALLGLAKLESLALPGETLKLALTAPLAQQAYVTSGKLTQAQLDGALAAEANYVHSEGDADWWLPAGRVFYAPDANEPAEARAHFFLPRRYRDPFGAETLADYDDYDLLLQETSDGLGNRTTAGERAPGGGLAVQGNDYRVLQPRLLMDANRNRAAVAFDALGLVVGTAVMGKPPPAAAQGDSLDGFEAELDGPTVLAHLANPTTNAAALLGRATTRLIYDLFAYAREERPAVVCSMARETHDSDPVPAGGLRIQHRLSYSDGLGREVQSKLLVEPGPVPQRDAAGAIVLGADGLPVMTTTDVTPRWLGSGWTVVNNKGKPVLQYEPFFTDTHRYEFAVRIGVSDVLFYDPLQRVIVTLHPDHTYEKVVFGPWDQATYDRNDTVRLDPRTDADARVTKLYFAAQPAGWTTWLRQRIDPANPPADSNGQNPERDVAVRTVPHGGTPTRVWSDPLGRPVLTAADNGAGGLYRTRRLLDIEGNERVTVDPLGRAAMTCDYDILGTWLAKTGIDEGGHWQLTDAAGKPIRRWNGRGHAVRIAYDPLRRPIETFLGTSQLVRRSVFGEGHPQAEALNLRRQIFLQLDGTGLIVTGAYDFKGNQLRAGRRLALQYRQTPDWSGVATPLSATTLDLAAIDAALAPLLEAEVFASSATYDALNRPATRTRPDASTVRMAYDQAALLRRIDVTLRGAATATAFVDDIRYDEKEQRTLISYANGSVTKYGYDRRTFRLTTLTTSRTGLPTVQALTYTNDPSGNITHVQDDADTQNVVFFDNVRVEPSGDYEYDPLYRLTKAAGREQLGLTANVRNPPRQTDHDDSFRMGLPHPSDGRAMGRYREDYAYDEAGNILSVAHHGTDPQHPGWTRTYTYEGDLATPPHRTSNRLVRTQPAGPNDGINTDYGYDANGNMTTMPHLPVMGWTFDDQLQATSQQVVTAGTPETTYYAYDGTGLRLRKVTEGSAPAGATPARTKERIYVDGWEVYREYGGAGAVSLERETLHVMDDQRRVAMVDTRTNPTTVVANDPIQTVRFQVANHLGSAGLELDDAGAIISYEEFYPYGGTSYQAMRKAIQVPLKRYRYTGKERDEETGLHYHGARYYAGWLGRWISCDPLEFAQRGPAPGGNTYGYGENSPIVLTDPSGRQAGKLEVKPPKTYNLGSFHLIDPEVSPPPKLPNDPGDVSIPIGDLGSIGIPPLFAGSLPTKNADGDYEITKKLIHTVEARGTTDIGFGDKPTESKGFVYGKARGVIEWNPEQHFVSLFGDAELDARIGGLVDVHARIEANARIPLLKDRVTLNREGLTQLYQSQSMTGSADVSASARVLGFRLISVTGKVEVAPQTVAKDLGVDARGYTRLSLEPERHVTGSGEFTAPLILGGKWSLSATDNQPPSMSVSGHLVLPLYLGPLGAGAGYAFFNYRFSEGATAFAAGLVTTLSIPTRPSGGAFFYHSW